MDPTYPFKEMYGVLTTMNTPKDQDIVETRLINDKDIVHDRYTRRLINNAPQVIKTTEDGKNPVIDDKTAFPDYWEWVHGKTPNDPDAMMNMSFIIDYRLQLSRPSSIRNVG